MTVHVRLYGKADTQALAELFFDAVRMGTKEFYSREQREAWAPTVPDTVNWGRRLEEVTTFIAEQSGDIAGFMTLDNTGYIDLAFVRSNRIRQGIGSTLYQYIEEEAKQQNMPRLHTQASELAKPFFEHHGWTLLNSQTIRRNSTELTNHLMEKNLFL